MIPGVNSFWPRREFRLSSGVGQGRGAVICGGAGDAPQRLVLMQTAASGLSCTTAISATECSSPQATTWPLSRSEAILHRIGFRAFGISQRGPRAALKGPGIVSVMRRRRTAVGPFLRPDAAHNATLCLGPLWPLHRARSGVFEAGLLLSGCAGRAPARHPNITLRDYAQRPGGSAVRRSGGRIIRAMFTCPRRRPRHRALRDAASPGASRRGSRAACRSTRACRSASWRASRDLTAPG